MGRVSMSKLGVFVGAIAALGACALALWWSVDREAPADALPASPVRPATPDFQAPPPRPALEPIPEPAKAVIEPSPTSGALELTFVDDASDERLADFEYQVLSQKGGDHLIATGRTSALGRTSVRIPGGELALVQTPRQLPYAPSLTAVRMANGESHSRTVRVRPGGSVIGRVVDDLGGPVAGAEIALRSNATWRDPAGALEGELVELTSPDGCFRIDGLRSMPKLVGERGRELAVGRWLPISIQALKDGRTADASAHVCPGELVELPALVLPRPSRWSGTVVDARGAPIPRALVSGDPARARIPQTNLHRFDPLGVQRGLLIDPSQKEFRLLPGECLTDDAGAFDISQRSPRRTVLVWTPRGAMQEIPLPELGPGEERGDLVLRIDDRCLLRFDLRSPSGEPALQPPPPEEKARSMPLQQPDQELWITWRALLRAKLDDGPTVLSEVAPSADGTFVFQLPCRPPQIESFELLVPGYRPFVEETHGALRAGGRATWTLEPLPRLRLSIELSADADAETASEPQRLVLRAFPVPPDPNSDPSAPPPDNSGPATYAELVLEKEVHELDLPLASTEPHWLYLRTWLGTEMREFNAGPFTATPFDSPDARRSSLVVPRLIGTRAPQGPSIPRGPDTTNAGRGNLRVATPARALAREGAAPKPGAEREEPLFAEVEPWREIELVLTGEPPETDAALELAPAPDPRGFPCGYQAFPVPEATALRRIEIAAPDEHGVRRARALARAGAWRVRLRSSVQSVEPSTFLVRPVEELQSFELRVH
jgi:hypothetical protein